MENIYGLEIMLQSSISQLIDTTLFTLIAFYGVYEIGIVLEMIISMWLFKLIIALLDTPFPVLRSF